MSIFKHSIRCAMLALTVCAATGSAWAQGLPDLDPDAHFKGKMGGTFGKDVVELLPAYKRVAVVGFRVAFVVKDSASAQVRASYFMGRDTSGANVSIMAALSGVDHAAMQAITDKAYADFLNQLKLAGREVVPASEMADFWAGQEVTPSTPDKPFEKEVAKQNVLLFSPAGVPLWFTHHEGAWSDRGNFDLGNWRRLGQTSKKLNAIMVAPLIAVNFVSLTSSGNKSGLMAKTAEVGATAGMNIQVFSSIYNSPVDEGGVQTIKGFASDMAIGTLTEVAAEDNKAIKGIFDVLGKAAGLANAGGSNNANSTRELMSNNADYSAAAQDVLGKSTGTFAKLFQKYPSP
jgi:hypothetical protein